MEDDSFGASPAGAGVAHLLPHARSTSWKSATSSRGEATPSSRPIAETTPASRASVSFEVEEVVKQLAPALSWPKLGEMVVSSEYVLASIAGGETSDLQAMANLVVESPMKALRRGLRVLRYDMSTGDFRRCTFKVNSSVTAFDIELDDEDMITTVTVPLERVLIVFDREAAVRMMQQHGIKDQHINTDTAVVMATSRPDDDQGLKLHGQVDIPLQDLVVFLAPPQFRLAHCINVALNQAIASKEATRLDAIARDTTRKVETTELMNAEEAIFGKKAAAYEVRMLFEDGREIFTEVLIGIDERATERAVSAIAKQENLLPIDRAGFRLSIMELVRLRSWFVFGLDGILKTYPWQMFVDEVEHQPAMDELDEEEVLALQDKIHACIVGLEEQLQTQPLNKYLEAAPRAASLALTNLLVSEGELKRCQDMLERLQLADDEVASDMQATKIGSLVEEPTMESELSTRGSVAQSPKGVRLSTVRPPRSSGGNGSADAFLLEDGAAPLTVDVRDLEAQQGQQPRKPAPKPPPLKLEALSAERQNADSQLQEVGEFCTGRADKSDKTGLGRAAGLPCTGPMGIRAKDCRHM